MNIEMKSTPWLDLTSADQRGWALKYLQETGLTYRGTLITDGWLDEWLGQERFKDSALLERMKRAWGQVLRRKASKAAGKIACSFVLSSQAKRRLDALAKKNKASITDFLETLLSGEYEQANLQKVEARSAAKKAADKEKLLRKKLDSITPALQCITELMQRTVMMEAANLSIDDLSEEQKSRSELLSTEALKKLTGKSSIFFMDELLPRPMERAKT